LTVNDPIVRCVADHDCLTSFVERECIAKSASRVADWLNKLGDLCPAASCTLKEVNGSIRCR